LDPHGVWDFNVNIVDDAPEITTPPGGKINAAAAATTTTKRYQFVLILHKTLWNLSGWKTIGNRGIQQVETHRFCFLWLRKNE
jgi:hypothetical protein